jgi:hypothetical protein
MITRKLINGHEVNVQTAKLFETDTEETIFNLCFCPRGNSFEENSLLLEEGKFPNCEIECEYLDGCKKDPEFPKWGFVLDRTDAMKSLE